MEIISIFGVSTFKVELMRKFYLLFAILFVAEACYAQAPNTWVQKANFGGMARYLAAGFAIGTKGYIGTGLNNSTYYNDLWEWDQNTNSWTQKANFPGTARAYAVGFSIGTKGYIGTGYFPYNYLYDFWEWDQTTNTWTRKADFAGGPRVESIAFSIGTKGYVGTGSDGNPQNDFWEWDQATNTWTQKAPLGGSAREFAVGFSIGTMGYIGTGAYYSDKYKDYWEWNQLTNTWSQKADLPGSARYMATGFSIGAKGYIGLGLYSSHLYDFWEWDQATNTWMQITIFPGLEDEGATSFNIGIRGYVSGYTTGNDFWEYTSDAIATDSVPSPICSSTNFNIPFNSADTFNSGNVFTAQLSNSSGSFSSPTVIGTLTATVAGIINVTIPANTPAGAGYRIRVVSSNPVTNSVDNGSNITINSILNLKFFTQGYYINGGTLKKVLHNEAVDTNAASTNVDTVIVELHNATSPYAVVELYKGVLQTNGTLVCPYSCNVTGHSYYIAVRHRNSIQTWSAAPVAFTATTSYDFTTSQTQAYGNNMIQMQPGKWAFYTGDINQDENVDLQDFPPLDYGIVHGLSGYYATDLNGDGNVDLQDFPLFLANNLLGIFSQHP